MNIVVWVLVACFVWYAPHTRYEADIRLNAYDTQKECQTAGETTLDFAKDYTWEGMDGGPAWLVGWFCEPWGVEVDDI